MSQRIKVVMSLEEARDALREYAARQHNVEPEDVYAVSVVSYSKERFGYEPHHTGNSIFYSTGDFRQVAEGAPMDK